jgi:TIR domain/WD domain, G-beta repeat
MTGKIFINYRRGDDPGNTGRLFDQLQDVFPRDRLFMDVDSIPPGRDFVRVLDEQVVQCDVLLAVIGKGWLDARDQHGIRRLDKPDDFVRIEIESALKQNKLVIPVLVHDAQMPRADELPPAIRPLARRNAVRLTHERFKSDTEGLIKAIRQALYEASAPRSAQEEAARKAGAQARRRRLLLRVGVAVGLVLVVAYAAAMLLPIMLAKWLLPLDSSMRTFRGHSKDVIRVAFSPDGRTALSGSLDDTVRLWEVATGKELLTFKGHVPAHAPGPLEGGIDPVAFSPDGRTALTGRRIERGKPSEGLKLWELATGKELQTFQSYQAPAVFSPNGRTVLSNSSDDRFGLDSKLKLWEVATGKELRTLRDSAAFAVAFLSDGRTALSVGWDKSCTLWDVATGRVLRTFTGRWEHIRSVAISPDGRTALIGAGDKTLKLWDLATGKELQTFTGHRWEVPSVVFSPDGRTALSAGNHDQTVKLWDVATAKELRSFTGHVGPVHTVAMAPDGRTALSGGYDRTLKLWDLTGL